MRAILIRCPECNAKLSVSASDKETDCEYCGARSQIQRRKGLLERVEPQAAGASALPFAVQGHSTAWRLGIIGIPTLLFGIGITVAVSQQTRRQAKVAAATAQQASVVKSRPTVVKTPPQRPSWRSQGAALLDLNGDNTLDVVGRLHFDKPSLADKLAAFDGATGTTLWMSDDLELPSDGASRPFSIAGDTLLFSKSKTSLQAFSLKDGAAQWSIKLPEALAISCTSAQPGHATVQTKDKQWHSLTLADGTLSSLTESVPPRCEPLLGDTAYIGRPGQIQIDTPFQYPSLAPKKLEGAIARSGIYDSQSKVLVALAYKHPGTAVPMLVGYQHDKIDDRIRHGGLVDLRTRVAMDVRKRFEPELRRLEKQLAKSKAKILWSAALPSENPTEAVAGAPSNRFVALQGEVLVVAYEGASEREFLTAFRTADGSRLWEVPLGGLGSLSRVLASPTRVYTVRSSGVEVFELSDGKAAHTLPPLPTE